MPKCQSFAKSGYTACADTRTNYSHFVAINSTKEIFSFVLLIADDVRSVRQSVSSSKAAGMIRRYLNVQTSETGETGFSVTGG